MVAVTVARLWRRNKSALAGIIPLAGPGEPALLEKVRFCQQCYPGLCLTLTYSPLSLLLLLCCMSLFLLFWLFIALPARGHEGHSCTCYMKVL